jgi:hypothetical protein
VVAITLCVLDGRVRLQILMLLNLAIHVRCHRQADTKWNEKSRKPGYQRRYHSFYTGPRAYLLCTVRQLGESLTNATAPSLQHGSYNSYHRAIVAQQPA